MKNIPEHLCRPLITVVEKRETEVTVEAHLDSRKLIIGEAIETIDDDSIKCEFPKSVQVVEFKLSDGALLYFLQTAIELSGRRIFAVNLSSNGVSHYYMMYWFKTGDPIVCEIHNFPKVKGVTPEGFPYEHYLFDSQLPFNFVTIDRHERRSAVYTSLAEFLEAKNAHRQTTVDCSDIRAINVGDALSWEYAYQRGHFGAEQALVAGERLPIPLTRPTAQQWNWWPTETHFLKEINGADWPHLVTVTRGYFRDEVFPGGTLDTKAALAHVKARIRDIKAANSPPSNPTPTSGCFNGANGTRLTYGQGITIRHLWELQGQTPVYIVDSESVGALYIFLDKKAAENWASRSMTYEKAREKAFAFIRHHSGWEQTVREQLLKLGVAITE